MKNNTLFRQIQRPIAPALAPTLHGIRIVQSDVACVTCAEIETIPPELPVLLCPKHYEEFKKEIDRRNVEVSLKPHNILKMTDNIIKLIRILRTLATQPSDPESV